MCDTHLPRPASNTSDTNNKIWISTFPISPDLESLHKGWDGEGKKSFTDKSRILTSLNLPNVGWEGGGGEREPKCDVIL